MKDGWPRQSLGELTEVIAGQSPDGSAYNADGRGMPFYQGKKEFGEKYIGEPTTWTTQVTRIALEGDVLMSVRAPVGPVNFATQEMCIGRGLAAIRCRSQLDRDFLFYFLLSKRDEIEGTEGAVFASINKTQIESIKIVTPPLPQQQRIVAILDKAFEGIATAKANAEKNLQNAGALFESHLQSVFTRCGEGWVERTIEQVCIIGDGNHSSKYPRKDELVEAGVPFIRATNLVDGRVSGADMRFLSPQKHAQLKKGHLKTGDILITNRGEIGKTAIVDLDYDNANLNSQIAWLRCRDGMNNRFLFHVLNSGDVQKHFQASKSGAALQQFTIKQLKALRVPSPPTSQQEALVEQLDALSEETQRLATLYERKLAALDELKKSLLHQAFSGGL